MIIIESYGIGIGKTTLAKELHGYFRGSKISFERINHSFLPKFYADISNNVKPSHTAFAMQFHLMGDRYFKHIEAVEYEWRTGNQTIHDRSIIGDHGFAHKLWMDGYISDLDYQVYIQHRSVMEGQLLVPQVVIRLDASPETCIKRLRERMKLESGRDCEVSVTTEYLDGLRKSYDDVVWPWFEKSGCNILMYDWEDYKIKKVLYDLGKIV